ncbi:MAG: 30S ribosomal protein S20 [Gammaproteobacteria bacterium]|nr:MAG: 30S ribosomal protein S20 [Gammaproteobacteria bacterium]
MANTKSAAKRARQAEKRRQHNVALRSRMRTTIKNVVKAVAAGDAEAASKSYAEAVPEIDKATNKGLIRKNKAARHKSRLHKAIHALTAG